MKVVHWCLFDRECRGYGCPPRIYVHLGRHSWYIDPLHWADRGHHARS